MSTSKNKTGNVGSFELASIQIDALLEGALVGDIAIHAPQQDLVALLEMRSQLIKKGYSCTGADWYKEDIEGASNFTLHWQFTVHIPA